MIRLALLLAALSLSGCHMVPMAGLMLGLTVADKALGVTDSVLGLIRQRPAGALAPAATGSAVAGDPQ